MGKGLMIKLYKLEPYPLLIEQFNVLYSNVPTHLTYSKRKHIISNILI
jgi:hypothetical protein